MTILVDVLLAVAFALTALAGLRNGFFRELFSLLGLVLGVVAGMRFTGMAVEAMGVGFMQTDVGIAVVFVGIFLLVFAAAVLAGGLLAHVWEGKSPGFPSRLMGLGVYATGAAGERGARTLPCRRSHPGARGRSNSRGQASICR